MADIPGLTPNPNEYRANGPGAPKLPPNLTPDNTPGTDLYDFFLHSLGLKRTKTFPGVGITKFAITYFAPQPVGVVPPQKLGLPEDYIFGFTPTQVIEALEKTGPEELYRLVKEAERREALQAAVNQIEAQLLLKQKTDAELEALQKALPPSFEPFDATYFATLAIQAEQQRRRLERIQREQFQLPVPQTPGIEQRGVPVPNPAGINWPELGAVANVLQGVGFIDLLAASLPPDP